jgi:hypothetical protein
MAYHYRYVQEPDESWAESIPLGDFFQIPGLYRAISFNKVIDGRTVVIQLWKGYCPPYNYGNWGGMGAEVGIYRRVNNSGVWMPDKDHIKKIWFRLWYGTPGNGRKLFTAGELTCWWRHKWLDSRDWPHYASTHQNPPGLSKDFMLHYVIKGTHTVIDEWWMNDANGTIPNN